MIPVYIVAGLLDSGKTSFIRNTLMEQEWIHQGNTLMILCEEGEESLPKTYLTEKKIHLLPVPAMEALTLPFMEEMTAGISPVQIIIEFNGMWDLKAFLQQDFPQNWGLAGIYSVANGSELELVMNNMRNLFMNQHIESDLIVVNRCDKNTDRARFRKAVKLQNSAAQIIFESVGGEIIEFGEEDLPYDIQAPSFTVEDLDYGTFFADASENPERYEGKEISFLCQARRSLGMPKDLFISGRKVMACCAADVQFYGFPCRSKDLSGMKGGGWYRVRVLFKTEKKKDPRSGLFQKVPLLQLLSMEEAAEPENEVVVL